MAAWSMRDRISISSWTRTSSNRPGRRGRSSGGRYGVAANDRPESRKRVRAVERAGLRVQVSEEHVEAATEAVRVTRQQYAQGAALNSDVLDAERALQTALARRAQAIADLAMARAALLRSTGRIW